ncbi:MAG: electron transfer flavoprotein subunit alpha/FixB family protein [Candidatus Limnocylindrales bacterium]
MSGPVLALVEYAGGEADRLSLEALALGRRLAEALGGSLEAVVVGAGDRGLAVGLGAHGVSRVHLVLSDRLADYAPMAWAAALAQVAAGTDTPVVLAAGSDRGNEVMAYLAARLDLPMAANVLDVTSTDPFLLTRQRWAGSLLEDARLDAQVHLLTVAPHGVAVDERGGAQPAAVVEVTPVLSDDDLAVRVTGHEARASGGIALGDARVVVGGGRGVGSTAAFAELEDLAGLLGAAVGVSRAVTSAGWRPHTEQIGQTGQRIAPELYIACGISGAIQHIVGCKASKRILAINPDGDAPIMGVATYAVLGDLHAVVPAVSAEIRRRREA